MIDVFGKHNVFHTKVGVFGSAKLAVHRTRKLVSSYFDARVWTPKTARHAATAGVIAGLTRSACLARTPWAPTGAGSSPLGSPTAPA